MTLDSPTTRSPSGSMSCDAAAGLVAGSKAKARVALQHIVQPSSGARKTVDGRTKQTREGLSLSSALRDVVWAVSHIGREMKVDESSTGRLRGASGLRRRATRHSSASAPPSSSRTSPSTFGRRSSPRGRSRPTAAASRSRTPARARCGSTSPSSAPSSARRGATRARRSRCAWRRATSRR